MPSGDKYDGKFYMITTHLRRFPFKDSSTGTGKALTPNFKVPGDARKNIDNRHETTIDMLYHLNKESSQRAFTAKKVVAAQIATWLKERFADYDKPILKAMGWFDPINWQTEKTYGLAEINAVYAHFEETLNAAQFDHVKVVNEWHNFRKYVSTSLPNHAAVELWVKIFQFKKNEYPNLCMLAELIITISGSNSVVERAFSILKRMLSDQRLSTNHRTLNMRMCIKINDELWCDGERDMIIDRALDIFMGKRRYVGIDQAAAVSIDEPHSKKAKKNTLDEISDDEEISNDEEMDHSESEDENDEEDVCFAMLL